MAAISISCPHCAKVLRTSKRPPEGKKVKCPSCEEAFLPEIEEEDSEATSIQEKPKARAKATISGDDDEDAAPRAKKSRRENDDDDDDDGPRKKKKKPKTSSMTLWILLGGGVVLGGGALLSCVLCGVGAFVWPGFLLSNNELIGYVAPDANIVMGGNPKLMRTKSSQLEKLMRQQGAFAQQAGQQPPELEDVFVNSERMLIFFSTNDPAPKPIILVRSTAADVEKLKRSPLLEAGKTVGGHANVHKVKPEGLLKGLPAFVAFPGGNIIILADRNEADLTTLLNRGKNPTKTNPALELSKSVDRNPFWGAMALDDKMRGELRRGLEQGGKLAASLNTAAPAMNDAKGFTFTMDFTDKQDLKVAVNVVCKNADDAQKVKKGCEEAWTGFKVILNAGMMMGGPNQPNVPQNFVRDLTDITFSSQGATAVASLKITNESIQELVKMAPGPGGAFKGRQGKLKNK